MVVIWVCICVSILTVSSAAPIAEDGEQESRFTNTDSGQIDYLRGKRLNNNVYTITPCAAAAAAANNMPVARSPEMEYANFVPPEARYYVPSAYYDYANSGYAGNMYRVEDPREILRYSDTNFMEQNMPTARFTYRTAPSTYVPLNTPNMGIINGQYNVHTGSSAPAYGIFPSGSLGDCSMPILFSCTPSVVRGQMVKPETQVYGSPPSFSTGSVPHPNVYSSGSDGHYAQRIHVNQEQAMYENSAPVKATAAHSNEKAT
ncbi:uncharacterized protein [Maniola hyperantus]|uniref:uncharacterized protein n=1 Tax=Aphantopus hyperantus TaxID=2795564 RepID=UPI0015698CC8|nr:uncharacterized protein LOC117996219 [Maniola hyperantus]